MNHKTFSKYRNLIYRTIILVFILIVQINSVSSLPISESFSKINDFFENETYKQYSTIIDFFLFFTISLIAIVIGAKAVFPEQRHVRAIGVIFAFLTTLTLIKAGISLETLIPYASFIVFLGLIIIIYFLFLALGLKQRKLIAFFLSLLITFIIFVMLGWVFDIDAIGLWEMFSDTAQSFDIMETSP